MSGPIVRKYGFPNHESIFGKKDIEHGVDEGAAAESQSSKAPKAKKSAAAAPKAAKKKAKD